MQYDNTEKPGFKQFILSVCSYTLPAQLTEPPHFQERACYTVTSSSNAEILSLSTNFREYLLWTYIMSIFYCDLRSWWHNGGSWANMHWPMTHVTHPKKWPIWPSDPWPIDPLPALVALSVARHDSVKYQLDTFHLLATVKSSAHGRKISTADPCAHAR